MHVNSKTTPENILKEKMFVSRLSPVCFWTFGLNLDESCILSSDRTFRSRHRTSVFSVHPTDPPLFVWSLAGEVGRVVLSRTPRSLGPWLLWLPRLPGHPGTLAALGGLDLVPAVAGFEAVRRLQLPGRPSPALLEGSQQRGGKRHKRLK